MSVVDLKKLEGTVIDGTYRLQRLLGKGQMGAVFSASHLVIPNQVAIKLLLPPFGQDRQALARFAREARVCSALDHPNIVKVHGFSFSGQEQPFLLMEYLEGEDLHARLARGPLPTLSEIWPILQQLASALDAAHAKGVVHRDLKPQNIFLCRRPNNNRAPLLKILDFGVSKIMGRDTALTRTDQLLGTPRYMAPEQVSGQTGEVDCRADVYACGGILYRMLTGRPPFESKNLLNMLYLLVNEQPDSLARLRPDLPVALVEVVHRALAKRKEDRFQSAGELAGAFAVAALRPRQISFYRAPTRRVPHTLTDNAAQLRRVPRDPYPTDQLPTRRFRPAGKRRGRWGAVVAVAMVVVALVLTFVFGLRHFSGQEAVLPPETVSRVVSKNAPAKRVQVSFSQTAVRVTER